MSELTDRYPRLAACEGDVTRAIERIVECYENGGKLLLCGNGGSAADCDHIVGELMKGFMKKRRLDEKSKAQMKENFSKIDDKILSGLQGGLPAISLPSACALNSAFANDEEPELVFAQGVLALGKEGDLLVAISTSGNSSNVVAAAKVARAVGMTVVGLTGQGGGELAKISDVCISVPECETYKVQEMHLPVYHFICARVEERFF